jgi:hypothetical protein
MECLAFVLFVSPIPYGGKRKRSKPKAVNDKGPGFDDRAEKSSQSRKFLLPTPSIVFLMKKKSRDHDQKTAHEKNRKIALQA